MSQAIELGANLAEFSGDDSSIGESAIGASATAALAAFVAVFLVFARVAFFTPIWLSPSRTIPDEIGNKAGARAACSGELR